MVFYALAAKFCNAFIWVILCRSQQHYRRKNMIEMIILIQFLLSLFLLSVLSCFVFFFFVHVLFSSNCCRFGIISVLYFRFEIYFCRYIRVELSWVTVGWYLVVFIWWRQTTIRCTDVVWGQCATQKYATTVILSSKKKHHCLYVILYVRL